MLCYNNFPQNFVIGRAQVWIVSNQTKQRCSKKLHISDRLHFSVKPVRVNVSVCEWVFNLTHVNFWSPDTLNLHMFIFWWFRKIHGRFVDDWIQNTRQKYHLYSFWNVVLELSFYIYFTIYIFYIVVLKWTFFSAHRISDSRGRWVTEANWVKVATLR